MSYFNGIFNGFQMAFGFSLNDRVELISFGQPFLGK